MKSTFYFLMLCLFSAGLAAQEKTGAQPAVRFHHLHLNVVDPREAVKFYTSRFDCEKATFASQPEAVWAQKSWLLFNPVKTAPPLDLTSAIWHFGWGAENMKETYQQQLAQGTKFFEPLTDISDIGGNAGAKDTLLFAYVQSPDNALIELNTARHHQLGHLHLFSSDPVSTAEWFEKYFGIKLSAYYKSPKAREPRLYRGFPIGPSASFMLDQINVIIFPIAYPQKAYATQWQGRTSFDSTRGKAIDHIALSVENLAAQLALLEAGGVKVTQPVRTIKGTQIKSAFIEGPDRLLIELVEGHADKMQGK